MEGSGAGSSHPTVLLRSLQKVSRAVSIRCALAEAVPLADLHLGNIGGIKAFSVFPLPNGTQRVIFILTDGSVSVSFPRDAAHQLLRSILLSLLGHAAPPTPLRTLHLSSAVYCSPIIISTHNAAWIFSSRGTVARIDLRRGVVSEQQTGICAASVKLDGDKLLVYDRREIGRAHV